MKPSTIQIDCQLQFCSILVFINPVVWLIEKKKCRTMPPRETQAYLQKPGGNFSIRKTQVIQHKTNNLQLGVNHTTKS